MTEHSTFKVPTKVVFNIVNHGETVGNNQTITASYSDLLTARNAMGSHVSVYRGQHNVEQYAVLKALRDVFEAECSDLKGCTLKEALRVYPGHLVFGAAEHIEVEEPLLDYPVHTAA